MVSIQSTVIALYRENNRLSVSDLRNIFPKAADSTLNGALSVARNAFLGDPKKEKVFTKITEEVIEQIIVDKLNGKLRDVANGDVKLAVDFLKLKRTDAGLENKLDPEKFLKRFTQGVGDGVNSKETDEDVLAEVTCIEKLECTRKND